MELGNFIGVFLARHVSGTYAHHQEHNMLSCSIWFSAPSLWMGGGLESRCVGRVYGADGAAHILDLQVIFTSFLRFVYSGVIHFTHKTEPFSSSETLVTICQNAHGRSL